MTEESKYQKLKESIRVIIEHSHDEEYKEMLDAKLTFVIMKKLKSIVISQNLYGNMEMMK